MHASRSIEPGIVTYKQLLPGDILHCTTYDSKENVLIYVIGLKFITGRGFDNHAYAKLTILNGGSLNNYILRADTEVKRPSTNVDFVRIIR